MTLTENDLTARLKDARVDHEFMHAQGETPTVEACADALRVPVESIVKSLLFADREQEGRYVLVLAQGLTRVDKNKLQQHFGGKWRMASPAEVEKLTGYAPGTVPPAGHATDVRVVMDTRVHAMTELIGGGGSPKASVRLGRADVERLTKSEVHDVATEPPLPPEAEPDDYE